MTSTRLIAFIVAALGAVSAGCPDNPGGPCATECEEGFVCDETTATCVRPTLPTWDDEPPGRGSRVTIAGGLAVTASIDPVSRSVVTGAGLRDVPFDFRILGRLGRTAPARVSIDASASRIAIVWVGEGGRFRVAWRESTGRHERWSVTTVVPPEGVTYAATEHFDVGVDDAGGVQIAYRDRDRTLRLVQHPEPLGTSGWTFALIDDGSPTAGGTTCPEREAGSRQGVGFEPDLVIRPENATVTYQDVDCGDLRIASTTSDGWRVSAIDVGDPLPSSSGGGTARVGRFSSLSFDTTGRPHVAYNDESFGRLLLATTETGSDWNVEIVDRGVTLDVGSRERKDVVGAFAAISFDERSLPSITYLDATSTSLRIALRSSNDEGWVRRALDSEGAVGFFADHAYDATIGRVAVSEKLSRDDEGALVSQLRIIWEEGT